MPFCAAYDPKIHCKFCRGEGLVMGPTGYKNCEDCRGGGMVMAPRVQPTGEHLCLDPNCKYDHYDG